MDPAHKGSRRIYQNALPLDLCQELLFIQRSLAVVGYRPHVQSLTLYELVMACPQLLPNVAKARQIIWDLVEAQFDAPCTVWPETTSLISWTAGASIGWHHDANRPYLAARHFSAVAYLSTQGQDFEGGTFCFESGAEPLRVQPCAGMLLVYTADDSNVHSVEEVTAGERSTLTMWFTLDPEHQEDRKVLSKQQSCPSAGLPSTMYVQSNGLDIRVARLQQRLGLMVSFADQQVLSHPQAQASQHSMLDGPGTTGPCHDMQGAVLVCCVHPAHQRQNTCVFESVHEAVMTLCMLEWETSRAGGAQGCVAEPKLHGVCKSCTLLDKLLEARLQLKQHLEHASDVYDGMLPTWHQLDALVPPG